MNKTTNTTWHHATVSRKRRNKQNKHKSVVIWFTGLSGSGKSTLAHATEEKLYKMGCRTIVLDGDNVRHGLCGDLGFGAEDREENIRRVGEMSKLFIEAGIITLMAFISPFKKDRQKVRSLMPHGDFIEIFVDCALEVCESRDVKGLYKRARAGEIKDFTGVSSPYEVPENPELTIRTDDLSLTSAVDKVMHILVERGIIKN